MRVVVSGGGTGGHIFPALALVESLHRLDPNGDILYIGSSSGMESEVVPSYGVPYKAVTARKVRKLLSPSTLGAGLSLIKGYFEARDHLRNFHADAVVGTGGYVAGAAVLAGAHRGLRTVILAPDAVPGRTNRMLARYARNICVVFPETQAHFPTGKSVVTGLPLRTGIVAPPDISAMKARCRFEGLSPDAFTVFVMGGSQGARALNRLTLEATPALLDQGVQILHQTGARNFDEVREEAGRRNLTARAGYCPLAFLDAEQMPLAWRSADVTICRGGISTLSEMMANGIPALVVPLPTAYADHQTLNAKALEAAGAALHCPEQSLTADRLVKHALALRDDAALRKRMTEACRTLGKPDAADTVARLVLSPNG